jgi:hypothetical protein
MKFSKIAETDIFSWLPKQTIKDRVHMGTGCGVTDKIPLGFSVPQDKDVLTLGTNPPE